MRKSIVKYCCSIVLLAALLLPLLSKSAPAADGGNSGEKPAVTLAVLPWDVNAPGEADYLSRAVVDMLSTRIGSSKGVRIAKTKAVRDALGPVAPADITEEVAEAVGRTVGADFVLFGSLSVIGDSLSLDAKLVDTGDGSVTPLFSKGRGIDSIVGMAEKMASMVITPVTGLPAPDFSAGAVVESAPAGQTYTGKFTRKGVVKERPPADELRVGGGVEEEKEAEGTSRSAKKDDFRIFAEDKDEGTRKALWKSRSMPGYFKAFETIDLDGDGTKELVLISKRDILIAHASSDGLNIIKEFKGDSHGENIALSVSRDGTPAVYISTLRMGAANGKIIEFRDGEFRIVASGIPWFMRTVMLEPGTPQLIGQRFNVTKGFYGKVRLLDRSGDGVKASGKLNFSLPRAAAFFDFELFDLTSDGAAELVVVDSRGFLRVYSSEGRKWNEIWKESDYFGGSLNWIDLGGEAIAADEREFVLINGRFFIGDPDGDGKDELIVKKNEPGGFLGRFTGKTYSFKMGEIIGLQWGSGDGLDEGFDEKWRTKNVKGFIADFILDDMDGDGTTELTMIVVEGFKMFKREPESYLLSFSL